MREQILFVLGGLRIGDTFHTIPFFNAVAEKAEYDLTWVHGTYAHEAVKFMFEHTRLSPDPLRRVHAAFDGFPGNLGAIRQFEERVREKYILLGEEKFSKVVNASAIHLAQVPEAINVPELDIEINRYDYTFLELVDSGVAPEEPYIAVQPYTRSSWKNLDEILNVEYPLPVKSLGLEGEEVVPGTEDCRGLPLEEVAKIIKNAKMLVGQHSALAILAYYLDVPTIILHFTPNLFHLGASREKCIDLYRPTVPELTAAINKLMEV